MKTDIPMDLLIQMPSRIVYVATKILSARKDMRRFRGTYDDAIKAAAELLDDEGEFPVDVKPFSAGDPADTGEGVIMDDDEPAAESPEAPMTGDADGRIELIKAAIEELNPENPEHFTARGLPRVEAIEAELGDDITMEERDAAWALTSKK